MLFSELPDKTLCIDSLATQVTQHIDNGEDENDNVYHPSTPSKYSHVPQFCSERNTFNCLYVSIKSLRINTYNRAAIVIPAKAGKNASKTSLRNTFMGFLYILMNSLVVWIVEVIEC